MGQRRGEKKNTSGEKKKHIGQGRCSSAKRAERAHPQLVHWWVLIHSSRLMTTIQRNHLAPVLIISVTNTFYGLGFSVTKKFAKTCSLRHHSFTVVNLFASDGCPLTSRVFVS